MKEEFRVFGRRLIIFQKRILKLLGEGVFSLREFNIKTSGAHQTHPANRFKKTDGNRKSDFLSCLSLSVFVITLRLIKCLITGHDPEGSV